MNNLLKPNIIIAFVGASNNPDKYGYKIMKTMLDRGYRCIPINPRETEILGQKCYPNLTEAVKAPAFDRDPSTGAPEHRIPPIDLIDFIVPPPITLEVLKEVKSLNLKNVWLQPGSESPEAIAYCEQNGITCVHDACVMIESA